MSGFLRRIAVPDRSPAQPAAQCVASHGARARLRAANRRPLARITTATVCLCRPGFTPS